MKEPLRDEIERERQVAFLVRYLADLIAEAAKEIWHWGDGSGGAVIRELADAFDRVGLTKPCEEELRAAVDRHARANALRLEIFERDAYRCTKCGDWHDLQIDHVIPQSLGGPTERENLQTLCRRCNAGKGARLE